MSQGRALSMGIVMENIPESKSSAPLVIFLNTCKIKGKAIRVTDRGGPQGFEMSRFPHFLDSGLTDGGEVVSLTRRPHKIS
jgi:hypothetical protein